MVIFMLKINEIPVELLEETFRFFLILVSA
jgi:hypothetical protein